MRFYDFFYKVIDLLLELRCEISIVSERDLIQRFLVPMFILYDSLDCSMLFIGVSQRRTIDETTTLAECQELLILKLQVIEFFLQILDGGFFLLDLVI